jgi:hypothetical protein
MHTTRDPGNPKNNAKQRGYLRNYFFFVVNGFSKSQNVLVLKYYFETRVGTKTKTFNGSVV